jgi:predicted AlkP superfamily pyrophosphatase or phosphodiesterase
VADAWYDRASKKRVAAMPEALEATTVADQLSAADAANRIYAIAFDSRDAAILSGGAPASLFYLDATGHFYARGPAGDAPWLVAFSQANAAENFRHAQWRALGAKKEAPPLRTLTYDEAHPEEFLALYKASPFGQAAQMALAREIVTQEKLGQGPGMDLLMVALGSGALLGYEVGGDSPLMRELVLKLDHEVELLLGLLDKNLGARNYALAFTSAHGATRDPDGKRATLAIPGATVAQTIDQALSAHYDVGGGRKRPYVERYIYPFLYLRQDVLRKSYIDLREARLLAGQAALTVPGVAGYYTADGDTSHPGDWERRFRNSFHPVRSGDVMLAYQPGRVEDYGVGRGISYGSLYNYDSRVPLVLYGASFENAVFETGVESVDLAPTLARLAGLELPSSSTGRVLAEALTAEG